MTRMHAHARTINSCAGTYKSVNTQTYYAAPLEKTVGNFIEGDGGGKETPNHYAVALQKTVAPFSEEQPIETRCPK